LVSQKEAMAFCVEVIFFCGWAFCERRLNAERLTLRGKKAAYSFHEKQ
jgi:hypothetical protein